MKLSKPQYQADQEGYKLARELKITSSPNTAQDQPFYNAFQTHSSPFEVRHPEEKIDSEYPIYGKQKENKHYISATRSYEPSNHVKGSPNRKNKKLWTSDMACKHVTCQSRTVSLNFAPQAAAEQRRSVSFNPIVSTSKSRTYLPVHIHLQGSEKKKRKRKRHITVYKVKAQ